MANNPEYLKKVAKSVRLSTGDTRPEDLQSDDADYAAGLFKKRAAPVDNSPQPGDFDYKKPEEAAPLITPTADSEAVAKEKARKKSALNKLTMPAAPAPKKDNGDLW